MRHIDQAYIDGAFVPVQGTEIIEIVNPATEEPIGTARLGGRADAQRAIAAAQRAQPLLAHSSKAERIEMLLRLQAAVQARSAAIEAMTIEEYGGPVARSRWVSAYAAQCFADAAQTLRDYPLTRRIGRATVRMEPVGVAALIAPWNSTTGSVCSKLASALAAGCASVIKPSELSPLQSQVLAEVLHEAGLPGGVFNILLGRGADVGDELCSHPGVAKISFTGSTATGQHIARAGVATLKRVSLALGGKSATLVLDDADLAEAIPLALGAAFMNSGQACVAGTRLLLPRGRMDEALARLHAAVAQLRVGDPRDPATVIGPLVNRAQFERVQHFIRRGLAQGATLVAGGEGRPEGLARGFFVKPTVFTDVRPEMDIAREEIFGPVLSVLGYTDEGEAVHLANDTVYGLQAYVLGDQPERTEGIAARLQAGSVLINSIQPELLAPFGGVKQSGLGREFGIFGLEAFLEPKSVVAA